MASKNDLTLSAKEIQTLGLAWQCMPNNPKVDIKKLAKLAGYTEGSCSVIFGKIRKKLANIAAARGAIAPNPPMRSKGSTAANKSSKSTSSTTSPDDDKEKGPKKRKASETSGSTATKGNGNEGGPPMKKRKAKTGRPKPKAASEHDEQPLSGPEDYDADDDIVELNKIKLEFFEE